MSSNDKKCCLCGCDYDEFGNNPFPLATEGKCCDKCNQEKVIKARFKAMFEEHEESNIVKGKGKTEKGKGKGKTEKGKGKGETEKDTGKSKGTDSD